jgi:hypothetical protein
MLRPAASADCRVVADVPQIPRPARVYQLPAAPTVEDLAGPHAPHEVPAKRLVPAAIAVSYRSGHVTIGERYLASAEWTRQFPKKNGDCISRRFRPGSVVPVGSGLVDAVCADGRHACLLGADAALRLGLRVALLKECFNLLLAFGCSLCSPFAAR